MPYVHNYSITGTDAQLVAWFDFIGSKRNTSSPVHLETLQTISFTVHEEKSDVRALGYKGVVGTTSSIRSIMGTMIFAVIKDHPLRRLKDELHKLNDIGPWGPSLDEEDSSFDTSTGDVRSLKNQGLFGPISTAMPPFNLMSVSSTEYIAKDTDKPIFSIVRLYNVELIGNGLVTSVNNIMTEVTYTFKASHYDELSLSSSSVSEATKAASATKVQSYPNIINKNSIRNSV